MTELERLEVRELELLRSEARQESFRSYVERVSPRYARVPKHLLPLYRLCEATRHRQIFAVVDMPPRHGKTETLAHLLSWWPTINPAVLNFYVTSGDSLANQTMRRVTKLATKSGISFDRDVKNLQEWHVEGYDGGLVCSTVGGQIVGRGCNGGVVVADDLIKGRKTAESRLQRDTVWEYFKDDMLSRLEDGASCVVVATRWHEDDPPGRLLKDGLGQEWEWIVLPAVHDGQYNAIDEREQPDLATPLWPEAGYDLEWARKVRARGEYGWWSLYQNQPRPKGRRLFSEPSRFVMPVFGGADWQVWFQAFMRGKRLLIGCDCAGTEKTYSDWSAYVVMALAGWEDRMEAWFLEAWKDQVSTDKAADVFLRAQRRWRALLAIEVNGVGRGTADQVRKPRGNAALIRSVNSRVRVVEVSRQLDKYAESQSLAAAWSGQPQRVHVPVEADWWPIDLDELIQQYKDFTGIDDPEDDLVDAGVNGWNKGLKMLPVDRSVRTERAEDF